MALSRDEYNALIARLSAERDGVNSEPKTSEERGGMSAAESLSKGNSVEDAAASGMMASGNPYAIGAGLGLSTLSQINKTKNAQRQAAYMAELTRLQNRQNAIDKLASISSRLKA